MIISLLMLFVMVLSVSATFAADDVNDVVAVDDETDGGVISTDVDDNAELDEPATQDSAPVVTKDNFKDYFDDSGALTSNATELVFEGDFSDLNVSTIMVANDKPVKFTGKDATFKNVQFQIMQNGVTIDGFNFVTNESNEHSRLIWILGADTISNIVLSNNNIQFIAPNGTDAYAIYAGAEESMGSAVISGLSILKNNITYVGTDETCFNNVIRVNGDTFDAGYEFETSKDILVQDNTFDITMPSIPIDYKFDPDTYAYSAVAKSEGMVFYFCENVTFSNNKVNLRYNKIGGSYDTISVVAVYSDSMVDLMEGPCSDITIKDNEINAAGHSSVYAIKIIADDFKVSKNVLNLSTEEYYTCGVSIDGPSSKGIVADNEIYLKGNTSLITTAYGIYAWQMMNAIDNVTYDNNLIDAESYLACGMEINQPNGIVSNNVITTKGNFTYGVAASIRPAGETFTIFNNTFNCFGSNSGLGSGDPILQTASAGISTLGNAVVSKNNIYSSAIGIVSVDEGDVVLDKNSIEIVATDGVDNYAITATGVDSLNITNNDILFFGKSNGTISNALFIKGIDDVTVSDNIFDIYIPSCGYDYNIYDNPAKGIVFSNAAGLTFANNDVKLNYTDVIGDYDTIPVVEVGYGCDNATLTNNNIMALGGSYIYGIKVYGKEFTIAQNNLTIVSNVKYANGVNPEAGATGVVKNNSINAIGVEDSYPIYSGMYGGMGNLDVDYIDNQVYGKAYYVVGLELGGANENVIGNLIIAEGNYTIGIGSDSDNNTISNNSIKSLGNSIGNQSVWDNFGLVTTAIKVLRANATISDNYVETTGDYAIDLNNTVSTVADSYVASKKSVGAGAIINAGNANIVKVNPSLKTIISAPTVYTEYVDGVVFPVALLDENGDPIANKTLLATIDGVVYNQTTDADGLAVFVLDFDAGSYDVVVSFKGDDVYGPKAVNSKIVVDQSPSEIVAPASSTIFLVTVKSGSYYTLTLKDLNGNGLANEIVTITFNGKTANYTTDSLGVIKYKLSATKVGTYKLKMNFAGDNNYVASDATATIKLTKQATKITAKAKTFKAKTKIKKYTITLKDSKGKVIKKAKVTLKIKGKTYKAKTNAKGKATFKIKKLTKKGTYKAKVKFAATKYYKASTKSVKIKVKK